MATEDKFGEPPHSSPSQTTCYPTFLYIGARKAGSSWMYEILRRHPEVFVPVAKDIRFFDVNFHRGFNWYVSFFEAGCHRKARGELWHNYFLAEETAERIKDYLPQVKLLACLREPADLILSDYLFAHSLGLNRSMPLEVFAWRPRVLNQCDYYPRLAPYFQRFPRENIRVLFFDDLKRDPLAFAQDIYAFVGVDAQFEPPGIHKKVFPASQPRSYRLAWLAYTTSRKLRSLGLPNLVGTVKHSRTFRSLLYERMCAKPEIPATLRDQLKDYYRERYRPLAELIGRPLPENWGFNQ